jgi:hypothetical protein
MAKPSVTVHKSFSDLIQSLQHKGKVEVANAAMVRHYGFLLTFPDGGRSYHVASLPVIRTWTQEQKQQFADQDALARELSV